jgi:hypothetical protein
MSATQQNAAKVAGFLYLFTMATSVLAFYTRSVLVVPGNAAQTATNITASERLFRIGIVSDVITFAGVVALVWGLYVALEPINRAVALLAAFWRLVESAVHAVTILNAFIALRLLSGVEYLDAVDTAELQAFARVSMSTYGAGLNLGFVFLGLGSTVFSYLWLKSRYVPRALAMLGILASLTLLILTLAIMLFPDLGGVLGLAYMMPMGVYEVGLGLWLLIKGLKISS